MVTQDDAIGFLAAAAHCRNEGIRESMDNIAEALDWTAKRAYSVFLALIEDGVIPTMLYMRR